MISEPDDPALEAFVEACTQLLSEAASETPPRPKAKGWFSAGAGTDVGLGELSSPKFVNFIEAWVLITGEGGDDFAADLHRAARAIRSDFSDRSFHFSTSSWHVDQKIHGILEVWRRYEDYVEQPERSVELARTALTAYTQALFSLGYDVREH